MICHQAATFISSVLNKEVNIDLFEKTGRKLINKLRKHLGNYWETLHSDGTTSGCVNYFVWSDVYSCPECTKEIIYSEQVFLNLWGKTVFSPEFLCPSCNCKLSKNPSKSSNAQKPLRLFVSEFDPLLGEVTSIQKQVPVKINYSVGTTRFEKKMEQKDFDNLNKIELDTDNLAFIPKVPIVDGEKSSDPFLFGIKHVHEFYTPRMLKCLSIFSEEILGNQTLNFVYGSMLPKLTKMNRYMPQHGGRALVGPMANTLYVPPVSVENNPLDQFEFQFKKILKALNDLGGNCITTQATQSLNLNKESVDYIFIDPPFGANIMYSELSILRESWLKVITNSKPEAIQNKHQNKGLDEYRHLMSDCFQTAFDVLKPGKWMTVEFSNTKASVWNSIQNALSEAGFIVANVSALDKTRGGLHAMLGPTAVKQDLIITAYKPEEVYAESKSEEIISEGFVWGFITEHLNHLSISKIQNGELLSVPERDARLLYDQLVAFYVRNSAPLPISSIEFQKGLKVRFPERDGMYFTPEQVAKYDKQRASSKVVKQISIFVDDEASSIEWLRQELSRKPKTYSEIHPLFLNEISGWKKNELQLELMTLLEQNYIKYDGNEDVPNQIHTYLSTNFKDMRGLAKDDPALVAKAKDRWYVPDPSKAW
ncbi:hypothetical protein L3081_19300 [Colwellia sp. MSW7]|uniref:DNA methylase n=1 Tax=Colwellia maritima TaxID=2912588 RepID=A0ABS9X4K5_9GAMM|nr:hypothetical protein [Colwellia maritima]MCI2285136.1 hypothetical protein [Colwellia maritima]